MTGKSITSVLSYDRFGWYWQPKSWLENLSPEDVKKASVSSTGIDRQKRVLLEQAAKQEESDKQTAQTMKYMVDSLRDK